MTMKEAILHSRLPSPVSFLHLSSSTGPAKNARPTQSQPVASPNTHPRKHMTLRPPMSTPEKRLAMFTPPPRPHNQVTRRPLKQHPAEKDGMSSSLMKHMMLMSMRSSLSLVAMGSPLDPLCKLVMWSASLSMKAHLAMSSASLQPPPLIQASRASLPQQPTPYT